MKISTEAPPNIALIKYWGKKGNQLPLNPSLSFSLNKSKTFIDVELVKTGKFSFDFYFEGKRKESFHPKLEKFFQLVMEDLPYLKDYQLKIESKNTFPHSTGIASSASSFAALSLALVGLEFLLENDKANFNDQNIFDKASTLARVGSGSACRSLYPAFNSWGKKSDYKASELKEIHPKFKSLQDYILIVDEGVKAVSSSQGHGLMNDHFYKDRRIEEANLHYDKLLKALTSGDVETFCQITVAEAMSLHALMMTSNPSFLLMKPLSLSILEKLFAFRLRNDFPFTFTLDAGPNIHLIFFKEDSEKMEFFLKEEVYPLLDSDKVIKDEIGAGAKILWK